MIEQSYSAIISHTYFTQNGINSFWLPLYIPTFLQFLFVGFMIWQGHAEQLFMLHKNFCSPPLFFL